MIKSFESGNKQNDKLFGSSDKPLGDEQLY